jgi:hypothetical protein
MIMRRSFALLAANGRGLGEVPRRAGAVLVDDGGVMAVRHVAADGDLAFQPVQERVVDRHQHRRTSCGEPLHDPPG